ncbi:hypothetical protein EHS25_003934 [Saitozyma podzolica]|uniref:Uncharacterized protein n=1 Tax=Saitozyma podzolica TaxID=1890683 RepID=A0A427YSY8_9TREE|nr:hypothetical protein EHS25_003934 [Saitozyma podzolica]
MPIYAEPFKVFDAQACGMLHFRVWAALEHEGYGANLQYIAEGAPAIQEGIRKFAPTEERVKAVIIWA